MWLKNNLGFNNRNKVSTTVGRAMEKWYCLSVRRVSYGREAGGGACGNAAAVAPAHRLAVHDLRGAWTKLNRDLAFALIDTYIKTQVHSFNLFNFIEFRIILNG